jgi:hypothetical protein
MKSSERPDPYRDILKRMEPDLAMVERDAALASIAISLRRIADALCRWGEGDETLEEAKSQKE